MDVQRPEPPEPDRPSRSDSCAPPHLDQRIWALAARQHGVISHFQLLEVGAGRGGIDRRRRKGWLRPVWRGVYVVGAAPLGDAGRMLGAVLNRPAGTVVSHLSAAACWGMLDPGRRLVEVTVPAGKGHKTERLLAVHQSIHLGPADATVHDAIPITTPARTAIDIAGVLAGRALERAIGEGERSGLLDECILREAIGGHPGRRGPAVLARLLDRRGSGHGVTASGLEDLLLDLCDRYELPRPTVNLTLGRYRPDFRWPDQRLIVETDGKRDHLTHHAFEADRERDAENLVAGWRTLRFTWLQLRERPDWVAATVRAALTG